MITTCPSCEAKLKADPRRSGEMVNCPNCKLRFQLLDEGADSGVKEGSSSFDAFEGMGVGRNEGAGGFDDQNGRGSSQGQVASIHKILAIGGGLGLVLILYLLFASGPVYSKSPQELFENYRRLSQTYDQRLMELFSDDATVYFKRHENRSGKKVAITMKKNKGIGVWEGFVCGSSYCQGKRGLRYILKCDL